MNMRFYFLFLYSLVAVSNLSGQKAAFASNFDETQAFPQIKVGHYVGTVRASWNADGRNMTLLAPFAYIDGSTLEWNAPTGLITDGASIPRFAWTMVGGPFEGLYRDAAVIHDAACDSRMQSWEATHEMFYQAMLTSKVDSIKAKIMYAAVYHFGPRWPLRVIVNEDLRKTVGLDAIVTSIQAETRSTNSLPHAKVETIPMAGPSMERLVVHFIPPVNTLSEKQFMKLSAIIESREKLAPGSMTLEQIRNYEPTKLTPKQEH